MEPSSLIPIRYAVVPVPAGIYNLLVGHYRAGTGTTAYRIGISELGSTTPSSIGRP